MNRILFENYKSQAAKFIKSGNDARIVADYLKRFKTIRDAKYKVARDADIGGVNVSKGHDRFDIDKYKTFEEVESFVDYVMGQVDTKKQAKDGVKFTDIEVEGEPLVKKNGLSIYYAKDKQACIQYRGSGPYSWCVSRSDANNMYNTYRYKSHEPTFYFVKDIEATRKEFEKPFDGTFKNKWHFMVIQKLNDGRYVVTSAENAGDDEMTWDEILHIQPKLQGTEEYFKSVPLNPGERERYEKFVYGISDEEFKKLSYTDKESYLDIAIPHNSLTANQFFALPDDLKNKYIGFGLELEDEMYEYVKKNPKLFKYFIDTSIKVMNRPEGGEYDDILKPNQLDAILHDKQGIEAFRNSKSIKNHGMKFLKSGNFARIYKALGKDFVDSLTSTSDGGVVSHIGTIFWKSPSKDWPVIAEYMGDRMQHGSVITSVCRGYNNNHKTDTDRFLNLCEYLFTFVSLPMATDYLDLIISSLNNKPDVNDAQFSRVLKWISGGKFSISGTGPSVAAFEGLVELEFRRNRDQTYYIPKIISLFGADMLNKSLSNGSLARLYVLVKHQNPRLATNVILPRLRPNIKTWYEFKNVASIIGGSTLDRIQELFGSAAEFKRRIKIDANSLATELYNVKSDKQFEQWAAAADVSVINNTYLLEPILRNSNVTMSTIFRYLGKQIIQYCIEYSFKSTADALYKLTSWTSGDGRLQRVREFIDQYMAYGGVKNTGNIYVTETVLQYCSPDKFEQYFGLIGTQSIESLPYNIIVTLLHNRTDVPWETRLKSLGPIFGKQFTDTKKRGENTGSAAADSYFNDLCSSGLILDLLRYVDATKMTPYQIFYILKQIPGNNNANATMDDRRSDVLKYVNKVTDIIGTDVIKNAFLSEPSMISSLISYWMWSAPYVTYLTRLLGQRTMQPYIDKYGLQNVMMTERHHQYKNFFI